MKDLAANLLFAVGVVVAVIIWYGFSNNFSGQLSPELQNIPMASGPSAQITAVPLPLSATTAVATAVSKTVKPEEVFLRGGYCKGQHEELLEEKSHAQLVEARKIDPDKYDAKCFDFPGLSDASTVSNCLIGDKKKNQQANAVIDSVMCQAFLKVYQSYVTDFLYPDDVDIKSLNQQVLQRKIQAQLLKQSRNPQLLAEMVKSLVTSYPNDFEAIKLYVKAVGFGQKPEVYAEGGPLYPYIEKAYNLNPRDLEIREMFMYAVIHSANGDSNLLKKFPNVKEDKNLQALRYYYMAWAAWNKEDRTQALNNLEFAKSLSGNDARYTEAYEKVKNEMNPPKSDGVFYLSFSLI